jgi:hypothetical protein
VIEKLRGLRLSRAAELVEMAVEETLTYYAFPEEHWWRIRTNNPLERILREIRRRTHTATKRKRHRLVCGCAVPGGGYGPLREWATLIVANETANCAASDTANQNIARRSEIPRTYLYGST